MKVSLNTIKQFTGIGLSVDELVAKINQQLGGVEEVIDLSERYKDATIVKVVKCEKHPNADKLSVCEIDAGTGENIQVVCGAPNVRAGIFVVWLPPKSIVPSTFSDKEPFVLEPKELRGIVSNGMLASAKELGIGDSHDGILEIDIDEWKPSDVEIKPGANFARAYSLDDTIIDIENKMFTHRPDLFGQIGVAREIAGIQHEQFTGPDWYKSVPAFKSAEGLELEVFNDDPDKIPRFMVVAIKGVEVKPSPLWLQCALVAMGSKPINNIVDVTNYVMLLTAQPTHAYDYDKLPNHEIGARLAKKGETVTLLNHKTYELSEDDIVIASGEGPVGLAGVMGGGNSEVSSETKNIVLEVANFDMYTVRKSSMRHGVFTDALTRFNKGQSPLQNDHIMNLLMTSIYDVSPGKQASPVFDEKRPLQNRNTVDVTPEFINERLGLSLTADEIRRLLSNVECIVDGEDTLVIQPPFWRTDIELPEDIVEEVGRLYGFDKLPRELPRRSIKPAAMNNDLVLKQRVRESLAKAGANEVLTYSFVHEKIMKRAEQDITHAYQLSNALSPDLQYYRIGLMPSLLDKVHMNIKAGYGQFAIFELNKVHFKGEMDKTEPDVPNEDSHIALVLAYADKQQPTGAAYYHARKYLEQIIDLKTTNLTPLVSCDLTKDEWGRQLCAPYDPERSVVIEKDGLIWGVVGEFKQSVARTFKLPAFAAGFEVHMQAINGPASFYKPLSKFPSVAQDVSLKVAATVHYEDIYKTVSDALPTAQVSVKLDPLVIYQADNDSERKTITLRLELTSFEKTLTSEEAGRIVATITETVVEKVHAQIV